MASYASRQESSSRSPVERRGEFYPRYPAEDRAGTVDRSGMFFKRRTGSTSSSDETVLTFSNLTPEAFPSSPSCTAADPARRSPAATTVTDSGLSTLVDACRRITAVRQVADIQRLAVAEAVALTSAEVGAFLVSDAESEEICSRFAFQSHPQLFSASGVQGPTFTAALLQRTALCQLITDEPSIGISPIAVAAVPAIASGRMIGMLVVLRGAEDPFGNAELETLNLLAPVVGSAIASAQPAGSEEIDQLTRLANRRRMDRDFIDLSREGRVGIASIRIDRFATLTRDHGADASDELLRQIALSVTANIRPDDVAYRSGDAEFVILLPLADKQEAAWVAERVRQAITAVTITGLANAEHPSASIGVTAGEHDDPQDLAERARAAMLEAEELGCNRVVLDEAV